MNVSKGILFKKNVSIDDLMDTCGTGGGLSIFNIATAIVAAVVGVGSTRYVC